VHATDVVPLSDPIGSAEIAAGMPDARQLTSTDGNTAIPL